MTLSPESVTLCCGTLIDADFRTLVEAASAARCDGISLWRDHYQRGLDSGLSPADMRRLLEEHRLEIVEIDALLVNWSDPAGTEFVDSLHADILFEMADQLGGRCLNVVSLGDAVDLDVAVRSLRRIHQRLQSSGLALALEFLPWCRPGSIGEAVSILDAAGCEQSGLMLDSWHFYKSGEDFEALASLPPERIIATQNNGVAQRPQSGDIVEETMTERELPGAGCNDLVRFIRTLDEIGSQAPIGVEVFNAGLRKLPAVEVAKRAVDAMRGVLKQARGR
jgi:sugar phosphate isomerase/epimerase